MLSPIIVDVKQIQISVNSKVQRIEDTGLEVDKTKDDLIPQIREVGTLYE